MANKEHFALLMQGVDAWNSWRSENRFELLMPDLSGADLGGVNLKGANLSNTDLSGVNLKGADLSGADLKRTSLKRAADLRGINLKEVDLTGHNFEQVDLSGANLSKADLSKASLIWANLKGADLNRVYLREANLTGANLSEANLGCGADLRGVNLGGADLRGANLKEADLTEADFKEANLTGADLRMARVSGANFSKAVLREADLREVHVTDKDFIRADLIEAGFKEQYLGGTYFNWTDLTGADLTGADLRGAELRWAKLIGADLRNAYFMGVKFDWADFTGADLTDADLSETQALSTNFKDAILTGTCIKDWNINSATNLDGVICAYVYLRHEQQERRPHSGNFAPGDFTKYYQKVLETVDLIFQNGVDWDAFVYSFKKVEGKNKGAQLDVQSIEKKEGSVLVVRVNVSPDTDKAKIHSEFMQGYEFACKALEAQYQARLADKDKHINQLFYLLNQSNEKLGEVPKLMAENPKYDLRGSKFGGGFAAEGGTQIGGILIDYSSSQSLSEAAEEIQQHLTQLQTQQGYSQEDAQQQIAKDLANQAKSNPTIRGKLVGWAKSLSDAAAKTIVSEATKEVFKLALRSLGISVP